MAMAIKTKTACINLGYYQIKANDEICFLSKAQETDDVKGTMGDVVSLNDKQYVIGIGDVVLDGDKSENVLTEVFMLNALCKMMDEDEVEGAFNVLVTTPPFSYDHQKEALPKALVKDYDISYNGKPKKIKVKNVIPFPESFIIYMTNSPAKLSKKKVIILDIGGKTTNICRLDRCQFAISKDYLPLKRGMYNIDTNIATAYSRHPDFVNETFNAEDVAYMRENNLDNWKNYQEDVVEKCYRKHIQDIKQEFVTADWNISNYDIIVTGGGGIWLIDYIKEVFPNATLSNDPLFDNVKSLQKVAKELFG